MDQEKLKTFSLICPSCGGNMELSEDGEKAVCPYCGHTMLIDKADGAEEEYKRRMAEALAEEDIKDLQQKRHRIRRLKGWLIALCVIAVILLINVFIPDSPMHKLVFPETADPFAIVNVRFSGMSGAGKAEVQLTGSSDAEYADAKQFDITPKTGLSNGDTVTVKARTLPGWRFEPAEKQFTVEGLTVWVMSTDQLTGDNLASVHAHTENLIRKDWEEIVSSSLAKDMTFTPYRMYLFISDSENVYEKNVLYDTYEVKVTREDGSVFTSYEACRYADLKIPADGVLTASFESLQGFNLGYSYGFSYVHSFSGWTDAAKMEADLRHARDGYRLTD